jgi:hypothetical protein
MSGRSLRCTPDHRVINRDPASHAYGDAQVCKLQRGDAIAVHGDAALPVLIDTVESVTPCGFADAVYDCTMGPGNCPYYVSNGIISHNCGEQALGPYGARVSASNSTHTDRV